MEQDANRFIAALRQIPLFQGLSPQQAGVLLKACERRALERNHVLCRFGDQSSEMFVLLSGQLSIRSEDGRQIARIEPIAPVGEMGLFTGEPRSATVLVREKATLLALNKSRLDHVLRQNPEMELAISRNLISILSQRIRDANKELTYLGGIIADQGDGFVPPEGPPDEDESSS